MDSQPAAGREIAQVWADEIRNLYDVLAVPEIIGAPDLISLILNDHQYDYWSYGALG